MGIPGVLSHIGKGERVALAKLAVEHFERQKRPLRIAIDAAIWNFQTQAGQGGKNPALRTLFFRLLKLLALPIHPVFVYDGKNKPLTKRGKTVSRYGSCIPNETSKKLIAMFQYPHHTAPGEAEAECASLQRHGFVDAVMSQDVDTIMFGSTLTLRDWSKEGTKGNKTPTHVSVLDQVRIKELSGLDPDGMILVALLSGGDYHEGVTGFGPSLACSIAKAGFGTDMLRLVRSNDEEGLREWRERLQFEIETNESGYFSKKSKTLRIPADFPDRQILRYYTNPAVTDEDNLPHLEAKWLEVWDQDIDVPALRHYTGITFDWLYRSGGERFVRCFAQPVFQHKLRRRIVSGEGFSVDNITEERQHFTNDGLPELRFSAVPAEVVGLDLSLEDENPDYADLEIDGAEDEIDVQSTDKLHDNNEPPSPSKRQKRPPWDPNAPEKWWIPQKILQTGLPMVCDGWEQYQRELLSDPIKFATRKCPKPKKTSASKVSGAKQTVLSDYLVVSKRIDQTVSAAGTELPQPGKASTRVNTKILQTSGKAKSTSEIVKQSSRVALPITQTFKQSKAAVQMSDGAQIAFRDEVSLDRQLLDDILKTASGLPSFPVKGSLRKVKPVATRSEALLDSLRANPIEQLDDRSMGESTWPKTPTHRVLIDLTTTPTISDTRSLVSKPLKPFSSPEKSQCVPLEAKVADDMASKNLRSVTSFFGPVVSQELRAPVPAFEKGNRTGAIAGLLPGPVSLVATSDCVRRTAMSRDSLPGTWKEARFPGSQELETSFIDLTAD